MAWVWFWKGRLSFFTATLIPSTVSNAALEVFKDKQVEVCLRESRGGKREAEVRKGRNQDLRQSISASLLVLHFILIQKRNILQKLHSL